MRSSLLQAVGVTPLQEAVYEQLLTAPGCTEREIARRLPDEDAEQLGEALDALEGLALVSRLPNRKLVPAPPGPAIEALALRRQREIDEARAGISRFVALHASGKSKTRPDPSELVELVRGAEAIRQHYKQLELSATSRIRVFDLPPYLATAPNRSAGEPEFEVLARGVVVECVYDTSSLLEPGKAESIEACVRAGEQARIATDALPAKLAIFDDRAALLPMAEAGRIVSDVAVLVHQSTLLTSLSALFDAYWRTAVPFCVDDESPPGLSLPVHTRKLLALLLAGLTNEAIGRQMNVTPRTVQRWVDELSDKLGAPNKYQMMLRARELGLV